MAGQKIDGDHGHDNDQKRHGQDSAGAPGVEAQEGRPLPVAARSRSSRPVITKPGDDEERIHPDRAALHVRRTPCVAPG